MTIDQAPRLILFCGLPGSGKSTLARQFEADGRGIRLCTDDWQASIGVSATDSDFHERLQRQLYVHALDLLAKGQSVILEDGLWFKRERNEKFAAARGRGALVELNVYHVDFDELWRRVDARNSDTAQPGAVPIERDELLRLWNLFERPTPEELARFDTVVVHSS